MSLAPPSSPAWVHNAVLALGLLLLAGGLIIFARFFVVILYAALGAVLISIGVAVLKRILQR